MDEQTFDESISLPFEINEDAIDPFYNTPESELPPETEQPLPDIALPYTIENNVLQPNSAEKEYLENSTSRSEYESSPAIENDTEAEYNDEVNSPLQIEEAKKIETRDPTGWVNLFDDIVTQTVHGAQRMLSETGEAVGAPEGWAGHIPEPETTRQTLIQGFSQYGSMFFPLNMAVQRGAKAIQI